MAIRGQRPKPYARTRNPRVHDWTEVPDVPNTAAPDLPPRRRNGRAWPAYAVRRWAIWAAMPHTVCWHASDWAYCADSLELFIRCADDDAPVSVWTELRARERTMATTMDARMSQRLRYVASEVTTDVGGSVAELDEYRNL